MSGIQKEPLSVLERGYGFPMRTIITKTVKKMRLEVDIYLPATLLLPMLPYLKRAHFGSGISLGITG